MDTYGLIIVTVSCSAYRQHTVRYCCHHTVLFASRAAIWLVSQIATKASTYSSNLFPLLFPGQRFPAYEVVKTYLFADVSGIDGALQFIGCSIPILSLSSTTLSHTLRANQKYSTNICQSPVCCFVVSLLFPFP